jgi:hypothetical protein
MQRATRAEIVVLIVSVPMMMGLLEIGSCGLNQEDFTRIASGGFGERLTSYPWGMEQFDGDGDGVPEIYVGTVSNAQCLQVWIGATPNSPPPPVRWQCRNDLWDPCDWVPYLLASVAPSYVYRGTYDESNDLWNWEKVFSPSIFENAGFRGARTFNGALYMLGMTLMEGLVWKTTDGYHYVRASPPGMASGGLGVTGGLRGSAVFNGKLYVANNGICEIYGSANPSTDPNSWENACSTGFVAEGGGTHSAPVISGTVTSATESSITDTSLAQAVGALVGYDVKVTSASDANIVQTRTIRFNTANTLYVDYGGLGSPFDPVPEAGDAYEILNTSVPDNTGMWQIAVFNGYLYAACGNPAGPELWKSSDPRPGNWTRVFAGGYGNPNPLGIMCLCAFGDHLYLGTMTYPPGASMGMALEGCEILRVDADDNVEVCVGGTRAAGVVGPNEVAPLSGMKKGFDYPANVYAWYMAVHDGWLYVGTYDFAGQILDYIQQAYGGLPPEQWSPTVQAALDRWLGPDRIRRGGADIWRTKDGVNWVPVNLNGFGDWDNYGTRQLMSTQWGLMVGMGNAVDGLEIWLGKSQP